MSDKRIVNLPPVVHVVIVGPVSTGKSIVLARIEKMLREEFGATTASGELEKERRIGNPDDLPKGWEREQIASAVWVLTEECKP